MKILSNFNTNLSQELYQQAVENFGSGKVLIIRRDPIYLRLKVLLPSIIWIVSVVLLTYIELRLLDRNMIDQFMMIIGFVIISIIGTMWLWHVCGKLIDYYLDFTLITPKQIVSYDQDGIFKRRSVSLDLTNLRSVNEEKVGLINSIFNFGTIVFFSEGNTSDPEQNNGTITLKYINYPRKVREKIINIIKE